ncbi:hypothetical protein CLO_0002 [Clostridium botulinum E1 str. 'BoNT E Beluga']|nr:hypothetical protein CLO_0002 [Clostridium botulinum E1 str. 'BoNT E Beluga']
MFIILWINSKGKKKSAKLIKINSIALNIYNFYLTKTAYL